MCNFKIGQEIVAVKDREDGLFRKGQIFTVQGLRTCTCNCGIAEVNVNIPHENHSSYCVACNNRYIENSGFVWFFHTYFAPVQTDSEEADMAEALTEIMERELFSV